MEDNAGSNQPPSGELVVKVSGEVGDDDEIRGLMMNSTTDSSSFTALLELSSNEALQLLHSSNSCDALPEKALNAFEIQKTELKSSVKDDESPESSSLPSNSSANSVEVKMEPRDEDASLPSLSPVTSDQVLTRKKRKEREKKGKTSTNAWSDESEKLPYVHVRARRGQATDSHSLAERARREKINARMKLLQELVPGCSKISGTALVLDEIINHVQSLQRQVEVLSMKLATVNPRTDYSFEKLLLAEAMQSGTGACDNVCNMFVPFMWGEAPYRQVDMDALHCPIWNEENSEIADSLLLDPGDLDF